LFSIILDLSVDNSYRILLSLKTRPLSRWFFFREIAPDLLSTASGFGKQAQELQKLRANKIFVEDVNKKMATAWFTMEFLNCGAKDRAPKRLCDLAWGFVCV
jgi:hypothetical protein